MARWAVAVAGAWLLPLLAHLLRMDVLLLPVIVLGGASLLRIGSSLVDRLVAAFMLTVGLAMAAGLLFSSWPWGLAPVPVAGVSLSVLVLVAAVTGRAPRFTPFWTGFYGLTASPGRGIILHAPIVLTVAIGFNGRGKGPPF